MIAGDGKAARAEAIGQRTADDPETEIEKACEREHQRHRAARRAEIPLQRFDEGAERIGAAEADECHRECRGDHQPAVEDAGSGRCLAAHGGLHSGLSGLAVQRQ